MNAAAHAVPALRVEVVRKESEFEALVPAWDALCAEASTGSFFNTPAWLVPWWKSFGGGRELCCLTVREDDRLIGLWALMRERVRMGGVEIVRLAPIGDGETGCDYLDILAAPGRDSEVFGMLWGALGAEDWDLCDLDGLWRESPTTLRLVERVPAGRAVAAANAGLLGGTVLRDGHLRYVCPHIPLAGTYETYLSGLGRRENLRRREKWLQRQPGTSVELARSVEQSSAALEDFFSLHRARWSSEGGSDGLQTAHHEQFHRAAVANLAARGWLRLYTLKAARRPVASVYGIVHKGTFLYYQSGYEPRWASRSVGLVLLARTVQDAYAEGLHDFDFLRGNESYKAQWARAQRWTVELRLWRGSRAHSARLASGGLQVLRGALKAAVPTAALESARRLRRQLRRAPAS